MAKVQLIAEVEPELERLVKVAAESSGESVSDWIESAVWLSLEWKVRGIHWSRSGAKPTGSVNPVKLRPGSGTMSDTVIEDRGERDRLLSGAATEDRGARNHEYSDMNEPPPGVKLQNDVKPIRLRGGGTMSNTVMEDRGER